MFIAFKFPGPVKKSWAAQLVAIVIICCPWIVYVKLLMGMTVHLQVINLHEVRVTDW